MSGLSRLDAEMIGDSIYYLASEVFQEAGLKDDFCIQDVSDEHVVFGGLYRLRWHLRDGWRVLSMEENRPEKLDDMRRALSSVTDGMF